MSLDSFHYLQLINMGSKDGDEVASPTRDDTTFEKVRKHVKEFVEASPEEHSS